MISVPIWLAIAVGTPILILATFGGLAVYSLIIEPPGPNRPSYISKVVERRSGNVAALHIPHRASSGSQAVRRAEKKLHSATAERHSNP